MKYLFPILLMILIAQASTAQTYEAGIFVGGSNVIGDIGSTNYISPNKLAVGGLFKWNRSPRHSFRASIIYAELYGDDSKSSDPRRIQRDYFFKNRIFEFSAGLEFTFKEFDLHKPGLKSTPYLYTGISFGNHYNYYLNNTGVFVTENSNSWTYGIPMVLGYKARISYHFILGAEIGARYAFTDELDSSEPDADFRERFSIGNTNNNDWYVFSGITLTYTFGRRPCYYAF